MGDDNWKQVTSFLTGAFTVGLVWLLNGLQQSVPDNFTTSRRIKDGGGDKKCGNCNDEEKEDDVKSNGDNDDDNDDGDDDDDDDDDDLSFVDPWNAPLVYVSTQQRRMMRSSMTSMVNIKNNIGELPKRFKREHWPWETIRRRVMAASDDDDENNNSDNNKSNANSKDEIRQTDDDDDENDDISIITTDEEKKGNKYNTYLEVDSIQTSSGGGSSSSTEDEKKPSVSLDEKELCIGSIFGLDVGGTLAKLVYFERKTLDSDPLYTRSKREKHYVQAVSAQTVLMARTEDNNYNNHPKKGKGGGGRGASLSPTRKLRRSNSDDQNKKNAQQKDNTIMNMPTSPERIRRHTLSESQIHQVKDIINVQKESTTIKEEAEEEEEDQEVEMQETSQQKTKKDKKIAEDLRNLYAIRQESLPDDVRQFRHSVDFHSATEKVLDDDIRRFENKDGEKDVGNSDHNNGNNRNTCHDQTNDESETFSTSSSSSSCNNFRKRSKSMLDLSAPHDQQTAEALDRFYDFARRLDTHQDSISDIKLSFYCRELGGEFHFISFETRKMKNAMDLIRVNNLHMNIKNMGATGGGAHKFADVWEKELGIGMFKQDELDSLVAGMQFALSTVVGECYTFRPKQDSTTEQTTEKAESANASSHTGSGPNESEQESVKSKNKYKSAEWWTRKVQRDSISYSSAYPYMLVTIGTGVSVLRVDGPRQHERVSGSTIGGGTFWGLMRLLTDVESFHDSMKLAEKGDLSKVDMMVGDIYGDNSEALEKLGLAANIVASSFGKLVSKDDPSKGLTQEDLARALLSLVTNNIGQVAYLNAKLHNTPRIYFVGSFLRENMISQRRLSYAIDYWSKGEMEALFLEHEGYFGALGAFLMSQNIEKRNGGFYQWETNP